GLRLDYRSPLFPYTTLFRSLRRPRPLHRGSPRLVRHTVARLQIVERLPESDRNGPAIGTVHHDHDALVALLLLERRELDALEVVDRKSTRLNSSHLVISYAV